MRGENKMNSYGLIFVLYQPTEEFLENLAKAARARSSAREA